MRVCLSCQQCVWLILGTVGYERLTLRQSTTWRLSGRDVNERIMVGVSSLLCPCFTDLFIVLYCLVIRNVVLLLRSTGNFSRLQVVCVCEAGFHTTMAGWLAAAFCIQFVSFSSISSIVLRGKVSERPA